MKLYSILENESGSQAKKGGNQNINVILQHQLRSGRNNWQSEIIRITETLFWNNGSPSLVISLPPSWRLNENKNGLLRLSYIK